VSHELRTPLTSIKGFISTLLQDIDSYYDTDTIHEFYTIIDLECDRLIRLINDLLNVSRIEAGRALDLNPSPVRVSEIVEKVVIAQKSYSANHDFKIEMDPDIPVIVGDRDKIDQILTNLINNAVNYSPKGGIITISGHKIDGAVRVIVADTGIGISKEQLSKVFDRFHRIDNRDTRKVGGTGIGLYLVKHLVEAHGGKVWVESEVGNGSQFIFELPKCPPQFVGEVGDDIVAKSHLHQPGMRPTQMLPLNESETDDGSK
jgi:two-component system phosphate regulon sensor histidine kinase PhoR